MTSLYPGNEKFLLYIITHCHQNSWNKKSLLRDWEIIHSLTHYSGNKKTLLREYEIFILEMRSHYSRTVKLLVSEWEVITLEMKMEL